jgi:hypothetical protein
LSLAFVYDFTTDLEEYPEVDFCSDFKQGCIKKVLSSFGMLNTFPRVQKCTVSLLKRNYSPLNEGLASKMKEISAHTYKIGECFEQGDEDESESLSK